MGLPGHMITKEELYAPILHLGIDGRVFIGARSCQLHSYQLHYRTAHRLHYKTAHLWGDLGKVVEGAKGDKAVGECREAHYGGFVGHRRGVAQEAAGQVHELLHKGL